MNSRYNEVVEIRLLPMSTDIFATKESVIDFLRNKMNEGEGYYYYIHRNMIYRGDSLVMFQYQNQLIGCATFIGEDKMSKISDGITYNGRYKFDTESIIIFDSPITKEEYKLIDPTFTVFSQAAKRTDIIHLTGVINLINKKCNPEITNVKKHGQKINKNLLHRYMNGFILYEIANHGIDPRENLEGTDLRKLEAEGYKYDVYKQCVNRLQGRGTYVDKIIELLPGQNLVDPHQKIKVQNWAKTEKKDEMESALAALYQSDDDETAFNLILDAFGGNFDMISFFFFAKDMDNYLPLRSKRFDERFEKLGIKSALSGNCTWGNYIQYISWIREVQDFLVLNLNKEITLLDAHSLLWILPFIDKYIATEMQIAEHSKFGRGVVTDIDDEYIVIRFGKTERKFQKSAIGSIIQLIPLENGIYEDGVVEENKYESHEYAIINAPRIASVAEWEKILIKELERDSGFDFVNNVLVEMYKLENYTIFCKGFEKEHGHKGLNLRVGEFRDRIKNIDDVILEEQIRDDTNTDRAWNIPFETDIELNQEEKNIGKFSWKLRSELIQAMENVLPNIKHYRNGFTTKRSDKLPESLIDKEVTYVDAREYLVNPPTPKEETGGNKKKYPPKKDYVLQQKRNKLVGDLGEEKVKADEIYALKMAGRGDLASKVTIVTSDAFGYDVVSFTEDGIPKHIEVKTSTSSSEDVVFQITDNEVRTILEDPYYELHYLFDISSNKIKKVVFSNRELREDILPNYLRPTHYEIKMKK